MHHLKNSQVNDILKLCKKKMKKNSKLLTEDPIFIKNQNLIAKFLIKNDRGTNVRKQREYVALLKSHFTKISFKISIKYSFLTLVHNNVKNNRYRIV